MLGAYSFDAIAIHCLEVTIAILIVVIVSIFFNKQKMCNLIVGG